VQPGNRTRISVGLVALAALLATGVVGKPVSGDAQSQPPPQTGPQYREWVTPIAPGFTLYTIKDRWKPTRVRVLEILPGSPVTVDVALEGEKLAGTSPTSEIAAEQGAIAAVNGDFQFPSGQPTHPLAEDGSLHQTSNVWGQNFSVSWDELDVYMQHPSQGVSAVELDSGAAWAIDSWNSGSPAAGEIHAYTATGGSVAKPPADACAARLYPLPDTSWGTAEMGVDQSYVVDYARCSSKSMLLYGGLVLATPIGLEPSASLIAALLPGETVRVTWTLGWRGVLDSIGGLPLLVRDGQVVAPYCSTSFCKRNPRTGVGLRADGTLLLVTVDGRQPKYSVGMTLVEFATEFVRLGAVLAMNLDGGGSTTMVVNGRVINRPATTDGAERGVSTAVLVLPGADPGESLIGASGESAGVGPAGQSADGSLLDALTKPFVSPVARDPGSTGGMLDALARGLLGGPSAPLPPKAARVLQLFRTSG
jgi:Phosphodiester glycosidase